MGLPRVSVCPRPGSSRKRRGVGETKQGCCVVWPCDLNDETILNPTNVSSLRWIVHHCPVFHDGVAISRGTGKPGAFQGHFSNGSLPTREGSGKFANPCGVTPDVPSNQTLRVVWLLGTSGVTPHGFANFPLPSRVGRLPLLKWPWKAPGLPVPRLMATPSWKTGQ